MITDPLFYMIAIPAILVTGISKGGLAGGIGLIAVPALALVIPPVQAAGIMLPILIAMDMMGVWAYRRKFDRQNLIYLLPGSVLGIAIGTALAGTIHDDQVRLLVGTISLVFVLRHWSAGWNHPWQTAAPRQPLRPSPVRGTIWGAVGGFTSFLAHAGSPPYQIYMLPQKPDKTLYVGTSVIFFTSLNLVKLPAYAFLGQLAPGNLETSALLLPVALIGMYAGIRLHDIIPEVPFFRVAYALIFVVSLKLIYDGLTPFFV